MEPIYDPNQLESRWQKYWANNNFYQAEDFSKKPKFYCLVEFPYPSGAGLHVGHLRSYSALDAIARFKRMQGYNVMFPIGWDAFGLPTENYAIKMKVHPSQVTADNIANFTRQLKSMGLSFDWSREVNTTNPEYYKWTQWIFIQLYNHGLAYKDKIPVNWCPSCKIVLANEEVVEAKCERCGTTVEQREKEQWLLRITKYADRLLDDLDKVDYLEKIKTQQVNWIGRSEGAEVNFALADSNEKLTAFTTRPDTLFGATYMVIAPEHELLKKYQAKIANWPEVADYIKQTSSKSELERTELQKEKTGVEVQGLKAINPANNQEIPIWVADYVLASYGTGAIMAVPGHDQRDWEFANKYSLPIVEVVTGGNIKQEAYEAEGEAVNSNFLDGLTTTKAKAQMIKWLEKKKLGTKKVNYKLRDWVFSRQHYWGEPIPMINCASCGAVPVPDRDLPVELPMVKNYEPTETGESPLAAMTDWLQVDCPKCGGGGRRETDTMPNWAGSSWYFLRYIDPRNNQALADQKKLKYWLPVDLYNGGMEHTTLHLLYSRFWHKFLYDIKIVPTAEPYQRRRSHGMVLAEDHQKMSKSRDNVISPDEIIKEYGADAVRLYEMFMGPFAEAIPWQTRGLVGVRRFLEKTWRVVYESLNAKTKPKADEKLERLVHKTIKKVTEDLAKMHFNTAVSTLMILVNEFYDSLPVSQKQLQALVKLLSPFAPHVSEELWQALGESESVTLQDWPVFDKKLVQDKEIELVVQVNGKLRERLMVPADINEKKATKLAQEQAKVQTWLQDKKLKKVIYVPGRLINFVVS